MKLSDLTTLKPAYEHLLGVIKNAEKRYGTKIYIDSQVDFGASWIDSKIYLHGERHVVNLVILKSIRWQHENRQVGVGTLYIHPATEMK